MCLACNLVPGSETAGEYLHIDFATWHEPINPTAVKLLVSREYLDRSRLSEYS